MLYVSIKNKRERGYHFHYHVHLVFQLSTRVLPRYPQSLPTRPPLLLSSLPRLPWDPQLPNTLTLVLLQLKNLLQSPASQHLGIQGPLRLLKVRRQNPLPALQLRQVQVEDFFFYVKVAVYGWGQCWLFVYYREGIVGNIDVNSYNSNCLFINLVFCFLSFVYLEWI